MLNGCDIQTLQRSGDLDSHDAEKKNLQTAFFEVR
jgi:hypothetical protein